MPKCIQGFMYTSPLGLHMARLYWRVKKDGKWTWRPAVYDMHNAVEVMRETLHPDAELVTLWWPTEDES